jgi:hypothetical protein
VQTSSSLVQPAWTNFITVITNGPGVVVLPDLPAEQGRFFRIER